MHTLFAQVMMMMMMMAMMQAYRARLLEFGPVYKEQLDPVQIVMMMMMMMMTMMQVYKARSLVYVWGGVHGTVGPSTDRGGGGDDDDDYDDDDAGVQSEVAGVRAGVQGAAGTGADGGDQRPEGVQQGDEGRGQVPHPARDGAHGVLQGAEGHQPGTRQLVSTHTVSNTTRSAALLYNQQREFISADIANSPPPPPNKFNSVTQTRRGVAPPAHSGEPAHVRQGHNYISSMNLHLKPKDTLAS